MRTVLVGFAVLMTVAMGVPRSANAHVSVSIGLPGFGLFLGAPYAPPVLYAPPPVVYGPPIVYAPPVYYRQPAYYAPPAYYRRPVSYYAPRYRHDRGRHRGWYKHDRYDD